MEPTSSWMIPPPYPFPEQWARVHQRQQRVEAVGPWLTPLTPLSQYMPSARGAAAFPPPAQPLYDGHYSYTPPHTLGVYGPSVQGYVHTDQEAEAGEEEEDEYEYGYVLRDEWRTYLRENVLSEGDEASDASSVASSSAVRRPRRQQQQRTQQRRATQAKSQQRAKPTTSPLALALEEARRLERHRRQERLAGGDEGDVRKALERVEALETALYSRFDAFCDRYSPTVWPQGAS